MLHWTTCNRHINQEHLRHQLTRFAGFLYFLYRTASFALSDVLPNPTQQPKNPPHRVRNVELVKHILRVLFRGDCRIVGFDCWSLPETFSRTVSSLWPDDSMW